jgi:hypothetical protein
VYGEPQNVRIENNAEKKTKRENTEKKCSSTGTITEASADALATNRPEHSEVVTQTREIWPRR